MFGEASQTAQSLREVVALSPRVLRLRIQLTDPRSKDAFQISTEGIWQGVESLNSPSPENCEQILRRF